MEVKRKQKPLNSWFGAIQCHPRYVSQPTTLTALMAILFIVHGCYGDQIERDHTDIDSTSSSQVQFKKHPSHQISFNFNVTSHDKRLLRDETIKSDEDNVSPLTTATTAAAAAPTSIQTVHVLANKSNRSIKRNRQTTTKTAFQGATATNFQFNAKRDQHRKAHQSHNIIGNAPQLKLFTQYKYPLKKDTSDENNRERSILHHQPHQQQWPHESVPDFKPKITSKLYDPSSYGRTTTYLSYNLVRDQVQNTNQFKKQQQQQPSTISYQHPHYTTHFQQTSKSYVYKTYYRPPIHRNNCNQCRIIPGAPQRHKPYLPNRVPYYGMYLDERKTGGYCEY